MSGVPSVSDLASDPLRHRFGDFYNPPGLSNFLGCVQSEIDLTAIRNLNFPPYATGSTLTAALVLDGRHFQSLGASVTTTWYPDKIIRSGEWRGFRLESRTILVPGLQALLIVLDVVNTEGSYGPLEIGFNLRHRVGRVDLWNEWLPNVGSQIAVDVADDLILARSQDQLAACANAIFPTPDVTRQTTFRYHIQLERGQRWKTALSICIGDDIERLRLDARRIASTADEQINSSEQFWTEELRSLFAAENDRYSGHLPVLETNDAAIRKLYWIGAAGLACFKRESSYSAVGRSYDTLMPRYWLTLQCIWDYYLSSPAHVLLDPAVMRGSLERWMQIDLHRHFGTEYLNGSAIGPWYAINDSAMVSMIYRFATWTGDSSWLEKKTGGQSVIDHALSYAKAWRGLRGRSGLAGFGDEYNLLECVGSYVHEVASLNAASIDGLRRAADMLDQLDMSAEADSLRLEAAGILDSLQHLYIEDRGFWNARMPDGSTLPVRHAFDLMMVLNSIPDDLVPSQRAQMVAFFLRELKTDTWMRALSVSDDDVLFSVRPDHQWTGAYAAWPSETAKGLCRIGRADIASEWMRGLARSANQGPFAQAHMADGVIQLESGGAAKSTFEPPYINDWASSSSGSWISAVIEGLFGVSVGFDGPKATPNVDYFDRDARLTGLRIQGQMFSVDRTGIHKEGVT